jgi:hypothetical protein
VTFNGFLFLILAIAVICGAVFLLGGWVLREFKALLPFIAVGAGVLLVAVYVVGQILAGVFSPQGLAYSFGLGEPGYLVWPSAVRVTTISLTAELLTLIVWAADYRVGRGPQRPLHAWLWAHASGLLRAT